MFHHLIGMEWRRGKPEPFLSLWYDEKVRKEFEQSKDSSGSITLGTVG